jgi:nucleotide-binding universal stress UspA family protein
MTYKIIPVSLNEIDRLDTLLEITAALAGEHDAHVLGLRPPRRINSRDLGAGMIVMGAYGHSRLREFILGGATRQALSAMSVPMILSH